MRGRLMRFNVVVLAIGLILLLDRSVFVDADAAGTVSGGYKGLDACTDPDIGTMQAFWTASPYWNWYVYIGGSNACDRTQPNLSANWINTVIGTGPNPAMHWNIVPIWVGLQAPCTIVQGAAKFSTDPTTAYNQGSNEALAAYNQWTSTLGQSNDTPVVYDLEAFSTTDPNCPDASLALAAARSFISGWDSMLQTPPAQRAGVYGSACASHLSSFATISNIPDFIWGGDWGTPASPAHISCVSDSSWIYHQRHKQFAGPHDETWNGVTLNVDTTCSDGWMYGTTGNNWGTC